MYSNDPHIPFAHIYIGIDLKEFNSCKVGLTTNQDPLRRIRAGKTTNPFYVPFVSYDLAKLGIGILELKNFEQYLHRRIANRVPFAEGGFESEWLDATPIHTDSQIIYYIANGFTKNNDDSYFYDDGEIIMPRIKEIQTYYPHSAQELVYKFGNKIHPEYLRYFS